MSNAPVAVPLLSVTFLTNILSPAFRLCGTSAITVIAVPDAEHVLINLGLRSKSKSWSVIEVRVKSPTFLTFVELDSWMMNPSSGFFAFVSSFGTTTLNLYTFSSSDLSSATLLINDTGVLFPRLPTPSVFNVV